jgi:hypothetical protein
VLTIGKLALGAAVTSDTIRYYEKEGLLAPDAKTGRDTGCMMSRPFVACALLNMRNSAALA